MNWSTATKGYKTYLRLERGLSANSIAAYMRDVSRLQEFAENDLLSRAPSEMQEDDLRNFIGSVQQSGLSATSQARLLSGIRSFYKYLTLENAVETSPAQFLEAPKTGRKLPAVLSIHEIERMLDAIDLSTPEGTRDRAMLEVLYSCGLRVSELSNLLRSNLYLDEEYIKVLGKGDKERLVPIGGVAIRFLKTYLKGVRVHQQPARGFDDIVFLNRWGKTVSRVWIFKTIKRLAMETGIKKDISPHTFRHSFATHLVQNGVDLRAVQEMLGHESITTTEIYTHLNQDYLRREIMQHHPRWKG